MLFYMVGEEQKPSREGSCSCGTYVLVGTKNHVRAIEKREALDTQRQFSTGDCMFCISCAQRCICPPVLNRLFRFVRQTTSEDRVPSCGAEEICLLSRTKAQGSWVLTAPSVCIRHSLGPSQCPHSAGEAAEVTESWNSCPLLC